MMIGVLVSVMGDAFGGCSSTSSGKQVLVTFATKDIEYRHKAIRDTVARMELFAMHGIFHVVLE